MSDRLKQSKLLEDVLGEEQYLIIVLDACRYDTLKDYVEFNGNTPVVQKAFSGVPNTHSWVRTHWSGEYDLVYVSPIPFIGNQEVAGPTGGGSYNGKEHFRLVVEAWDEYWSDDERCVLPESVVEAVLDHKDNRMVAHFGQPHMPHIGKPSLYIEEYSGNNLAEIGPTLGKARVKASYEACLSEVWHRGVKPLVEEFQGRRIVITADHGEALGEGGRYGHNTKTPEVMTVPWIEVEGEL